MNAIINAWRPSLPTPEQIWENRLPIFYSCAAAATLLTIAGVVCRYQDGFGVLCALVCISWIVPVCVSLGSKPEYAEENSRPYTRGAALVALFSLTSFFFIGPTNGVWVIPERGETSLSHSLIWAPAFFTPPVHWVPATYKLSTSLQVHTADNVPIDCTIGADGISLDQRNPEELARWLLQMTAGLVNTDARGFITGELDGALTRSAKNVLSVRSSDAIARQGQFLIPYQIGTPMGNTLAENRLRWQDGTVSFSCELTKFQS